MELATVSLEILTQRINKLLGTKHSSPYISGVRNGHTGSAALQHVVREETAAMLREAADIAKRMSHQKKPRSPKMTSNPKTLTSLLLSLTSATSGYPRSEHGPIVRRWMDAHPEVAIVLPGMESAMAYVEAMQMAGAPGAMSVEF